jgi:hypothetical protein
MPIYLVATMPKDEATMSNSIQFPVFKAIAIPIFLVVVLSSASSAAPDNPSAGAKVSSFAAAEDLANQLKSIIARVDESLTILTTRAKAGSPRKPTLRP